MTQQNGSPRFPTTEWTLIGRLQSDDPVTVRRALEDLCNQYHYPLYCYIRRRGYAHHDAEDALHDFFAKLLRLHTFDSADANKGRLRAYLATALQRFLLNWSTKRKIAGPAEEGTRHPAINLQDAEDRYHKEHVSGDESPESYLDRQWARELLARVLAKLAASYAAKDKGQLFSLLSPSLLDGGSLRGQDHAALAEQIGMKPNTLRVAFARLLRDFRATLEDEVFQTVDSRDAVAEELASLRRIVGGG